MKLGKIPMELLDDLLGTLEANDPSVLLGPRVGADSAVIKTDGELIVAKSDPVTFASEYIGWYVVQINANDIACLGAKPKWFLATLLLPEGTSQTLLREIFDQILTACTELGVTLIGGHTEITQRVDKPVIAGTMLGTVEPKRTVWPSGAQDGDTLLLTKSIALEGTSIIAKELEPVLLNLGLPQTVIDRAKTLLSNPGISVVRDAQVACEITKIHAMHDPTEGGLATGLFEMAHSAGLGLVVDNDAIPIIPECYEICNVLGLNPLGLLASGSLLLAVDPGDATNVVSALSTCDIRAQPIGRFTDQQSTVTLQISSNFTELPKFERDEIARVFEEYPSNPNAGNLNDNCN